MATGVVWQVVATIRRVSYLSPVLTGAPLDVRRGDDNGYVEWPVFSGALGTRKAYLCFLRFWQRDRRPLGTQLAAIGLAECCNDVSARCVRPKK
jgi:hypothetical protein